MDNHCAVQNAIAQFAEVEQATSEALKNVRGVPDNYDVSFDTLPDDTWAQLAPYAPKMMDPMERVMGATGQQPRTPNDGRRAPHPCPHRLALPRDFRNI